MRLAAAVALVAFAALPAAAHDPAECEREVASAKRLFETQRARRLRLVDPLARTVRHLLDRLTDEDRAIVARFARREVAAAEVDRALWPKLYPALDKFNRAGCRALGGVVRADSFVEASTALAGGRGLHTGVVVACARRPLQGEARRFLGLRVKHGDAGPVVILHGFVQERETVFASALDARWAGLTVDVPLGDRAAELAALESAVAAFAGSEDDFTWAVPAACQPRMSLAP